MDKILLASSVVFIMSAILIMIYFTFSSKIFKGLHKVDDRKTLIDYGSLISNLAGPLFAIGGSLIIYSTIIRDNKEENLKHFESIYFKLVDYHRENNENIMILKSPLDGRELKGKNAFLNFDYQIRMAIKVCDSLKINFNEKQAFNTAFIIFYIGTDNITEKKILRIKLGRYFDSVKINSLVNLCNNIKHHKSHKSFFRGNKAILSTYFLMFFDALEYLENQNDLTYEEKLFYAKLLLSNNTIYQSELLYIYSQSDLAGAGHNYLAKKYIHFTDTERINLNGMLKTQLKLKF